ncbi:hypothetical protein NQ215_24180, partial [Escherichia coli]|nr:hypothetical protein [Escherichia coli]
VFDDELEEALGVISEDLKPIVGEDFARYYAIKAFENDDESMNHITIPSDVLAKIEKIRYDFEAKEDDDCESIITTGRYENLA